MRGCAVQFHCNSVFLKIRLMITKELIALSVCSVITEVTVEDIMKHRSEPGAKEDKVRLARQLCMSFARKYKLGSQADVGNFYGGRDHATCLHSEKIIDREIKQYQETAILYHRIEIRILEDSLKNLKQLFKEQMEMELAYFLRRAQGIADTLLKDIEKKEEDLKRISTFN